MTPDTEQIIVILEGLLDGSYSSQRANDELKDLSFEGLDGVYSYLPHYLADEDIREKDERYRNFQNSEMKKLIHHLKESNFEKANNVSFLQET